MDTMRRQRGNMSFGITKQRGVGGLGRVPLDRKPGWLILTGLVFCFAGISSAQQDTVQKLQPETRRLEIPVTPVDSTAIQTQSRMPKIDLPEYVITGDASINMPMLQKEPASEDTQVFPAISLLNAPLKRSRPTAQAAMPLKETLTGEPASMFNGTAFASLGTFFTPQAGLWYGRSVGDYLYSFDGRYYRTKGFAPFTDRSGGSLSAQGGMTLKSENPNFDQARLLGNLEYRSDTYNWYGTRQPGLSRNRSNLGLSAELSNGGIYSIPYSAEIGVNSFQLIDSTANVSETTVRAGGTTHFSLSSVPLNAGLRLQFGSISGGNSSGSLAFVDAMLGSQRYDVQNFWLEGSLHVYLAGGMGGQKLPRLYPHLDVAYFVSPIHILRGTFDPEISSSTLSSTVIAQRYVSGVAQVRHSDDRYDGALALESEWSPHWSTKIEARMKSVVDYPLYADSVSRGVWLLAYGGRTTIATISGEIFAKLQANDYFASQFVVTVSHNSVSGNNVPYLPDLELESRYVRRIVDRVTAIATLTLIHIRRDNVVNVGTLPSILLIGLRGEYQILQQSTAFLEIQNLLDQKYEYWKGYQENPLTISAGISFRW